MMRLIAVIAGLLLSAIGLYADAQIITIRVNRSTGDVCVATPSGVMSSKTCEDGDDGTGGLAWATIGPFTNKIDGAGTFCVNLRTTFLTEPGSPNATLSLVGSVANWSLSTDDLCYDGTGVSSGTLIARASRSGVISDSLSFAVSSVAAASTDITPPTIITGVTLAMHANDEDVIVTFDAPADVRVAGQDVSGLATFTVLRDGTPLTPTAFTGTGLDGPVYVSEDIGDLDPNGTATQNGSAWIHQAEGGISLHGDEFLFTNTTITGDFTCTVKGASISGGATARGYGLMMMEDTVGLSKFFGIELFTSTNSRTYNRITTGGAEVEVGLLDLDVATGWIQIQRAGNVLTGRLAADGNDWGVVHSMTLGLNATLKAGIDSKSAEVGVEKTVEYENLACTTRPRQTFTDTGTTPGVTHSYTVIATDVANNDSVPSAAETIAVPPVVPPPPGDSETPDYVDPVAGVTLLGGRATVTPANSGELALAVTNADCGDDIELSAATYTGNYDLDVVCPANNPIIVSGAGGFGTTANGTWTLSGARNIVTGINFQGANVQIFLHGQNNKIIGNQFRSWTGRGVITSGDAAGKNQNEIAYNDFGPGGGGNFRWTIKAQSSNQESSVPKNTWIHHNRFDDIVSQDGRGDAIEPGESGQYPFVPTLVSGWYIEDNLFTNMGDGGQAFLDMKFGGCVIRRNTVSVSENVRLQTRQGTNCIIESNYMEDGLIQINGRGHKVVCNFGPIVLNAGENEWNTPSNGHPRAYEVLVAHNIGTVRVGDVPNGNYNLPAFDTTIEQHPGGVTFGLHTSTNDNRNDPSSYDCAPAVELTAGDVGPGAIAGAPAQYKAARGL